jgi:hypothetical protein
MKIPCLPIHSRIMQNEHDNPMLIRFVGDEMTLKIILLLCDPIVTVNILVSCVIGLKKRF